MSMMQADELNAKAVIAAALIQTRQVDVTLQVKDATEPWTKYEGMRRLHQLTNLIYDAISSPG
jgi:hypothetical protein